MSARFEFGGGRELVDGTKAKTLLQSIETTNPTSIKLSNKSFDQDAANVIATRLREFQSIEVADLSDIIAGRPEDEALKVLEIICNSLSERTLIELNVSDNAMGSKGVNACRAVFVMKKLQKLWINNDGMAAESCELIAQILLDGGCPPLTLLHFYNNMAGDGGACALSNVLRACPALEDLRFSATRAGMDGCLSIAQALNTLSKLKHVDLNDCNFSKQAGPEIASALSKQTNLEVLLIRDANLGDAGIKAILDALSSSTTSKLSKLDMSGNDLTERGWKHLTATLKKPAFAMLTELSVDDCELESELACAFAATLLHLTHLKSLHLCQCALQAGGAVAIATAVSRLSSFRDLKLEDNAINSSALAHIEKLFESTGKVLVPLEENDGDGEDDLEDHQESIDELMGPVINSVDTSVDALAGQLSVAKI